MKVYFSCSLTGGRGDQPVYAAIVNGLQAQGHTVLTAHLARPDVVDQEASLEPAAVYGRDIAWLDEADAVAAEVSTPSHGVGYEIAYALLSGKRVMCLAREAAQVSKMIAGNPRLAFVRYEDPEHAVGQIARFLGRAAEDKYA
jgi:nucleoside 2-deoxyribosyltransferase